MARVPRHARVEQEVAPVAGPFAPVLLLLPASLGTVLLVGLAAVVIESPVRLLMRVVLE